MSTIHPGAVVFSAETRRAIADGDLFDGNIYNVHVRADGCCLVGALLNTEFPELQDFYRPFFDEARQAFERMGRPLSWQQTILVDELIKRNDRGLYADRATLRRDLLGEEQPR